MSKQRWTKIVERIIRLLAFDVLLRHIVAWCNRAMGSSISTKADGPRDAASRKIDYYHAARRVYNHQALCDFLPRDALLSAVYAVVVCLSMCLCVCHTPVLY